ncbi:MAG: 3-methyl-2-oxobutanoate hydroxymethyltransferase [Crenarchaeota archaeon 13_1_20CM_2_53_14]|nr:MAG: 3-methyl-2-oxobutanoate hydroxymethyltransferase [archaeon 13_1_40CM_2_52_13]OLE59438.1 MAG: 3-methyl-2-oxobutanoate hydroxymethyltransferase [Crenarchaeota archaeon 13_1_20CM_2_53_14]TMI41665.1 MAG: 3-methyl-2-oxobutanoate hydroxymethyltransferase [Candidatus Bathyarchaeota archaeon]
MSVASFMGMKAENRKIVMVTSYDYPTAAIADAVGVDSILVGDSYGMVILGYENTIPVTVEELLPVCRAVRRGATHPLLIGDMPFMSFQVSPEEAVRTAGRFVKEGGVEAVKIEGGSEASKTVQSISRIGIPVLGHIGVTPQTATLHGGYRIQGRNADSRDKLVADAKSLEEAGVFGIVLEMITEEVARVITETVSVPTIGIGSGRFCDGQVLVLHDIIGLYPNFAPKFAKRYTDVAAMIRQALQNFAADVRNGVFPEEQHVFRMEEDRRAKLDSKRKI